MIWPFNIIQRRARQAEVEAARAEALARQAQSEIASVERKWPEVRAAASWAKERREQNHLTALFLKQLRSGSGNG